MISPQLDVFAVLIFLGVIQAVFLTIIVGTGKPRLELSNRFFTFYLLANAATLLEVFLCYSGYIIYWLHYYDSSEPFNFTTGPLLFFYIYAFLKNTTPRNWWWHFIPFGLYALYAIFFFMQSASYKYNAFLNAYHPEITRIVSQELFSEDPLGIKAHINLISIIFNGVYFFLIIRLLRNHLIQHGLKLWSLTEPALRWVRTLLILAGVSYLHWVYRTFFVYQDLEDYTSAAMDALAIYYISFVMLQQPEIFRKKPVKQAKYVKSNLGEKDKTTILAQLIHLMEEEKIYRDNLLSLPQLAKRMKVSSHSISQVLNENLRKNFFGLLADYRIKDATQILTDPSQQHLTIEQVAEKVGYNSKSAFNNAFKKITNRTPSAYRKEFPAE